MRRILTMLFGNASFAVLSFATAHAGTLPANGHFVSGQGSISKANQSLTVKQSSTTSIIDWNSFSVGKNNGVTFDNGMGATLNRVTGGNLSRIAGSLHATGSFFLMNNAGVIVSGTGHIVTGGSFVASSGDIAGDAFGSHRLKFNTGNGIVINRGSITSGGNAVLNGRGVANEGSIAASSIRLNATTGNALDSGTITASGNAHNGAAHIYIISQSGKTRITGDLTAHGVNGAGIIETSGHMVSLAGHIDAGKGGVWTVDPEDLVIHTKSATTIDNALNAGTNVKLRTTANGTSGPGTVKSGPGDIEIMAPLSWNTSATLTLDAYHSVHFNDLVSITGAGNLVIVTNDGGTSGALRFLDGSADYGATDNGGTLTINGDAYTLVYDMTELQNINNNLNANYALATSQDASSVSSWLPIGIKANGSIANADKGFVGNFEGLGHTVSNLVLDSTQATEQPQYLGLFGYASSGTISDFGMIGGSITGNGDSGSTAGAIAAVANAIFNCFSSASVSSDITGGVVGSATSISYSYATGSVSGITEVGGLTGMSANVSSSYATGNVSGAVEVGGLVGSSANVSNSYATGDVTGNTQVGGLVGSSGNVSDSYATGDISAVGEAGGLIGLSDASSEIRHVHSTGSVTASGGIIGGLIGLANGEIRNAYAKGMVETSSGDDVGGLVGYGDGSVNIIHSHATGAVAGNGNVGGLVGLAQGVPGGGNEIVGSYATGSVSDGADDNTGGLVGEANLVDIIGSYASGKVTGLGSEVGGLVGFAAATISDSYATGSIAGRSKVGGLMGAAEGADIVDSYATGNVHAQRKYVGGLVGSDRNFGKPGVTITDSYATGRVYGHELVGGLAGVVGKTKVSDSYATGAVHGKINVGGFVGFLHMGTIFTSYSIGAVFAHGKNGGGFAGKSEGDFSDDYWDTDTSGLTNGIGNIDEDGVTGLTTAQFQSGLPTGFDSSVWAEDPSINNGLPYLIALASSY